MRCGGSWPRSAWPPNRRPAEPCLRPDPCARSRPTPDTALPACLPTRRRGVPGPTSPSSRRPCQPRQRRPIVRARPMEAWPLLDAWPPVANVASGVRPCRCREPMGDLAPALRRPRRPRRGSPRGPMPDTAPGGVRTRQTRVCARSAVTPRYTPKLARIGMDGAAILFRTAPWAGLRMPARDPPHFGPG